MHPTAEAVLANLFGNMKLENHDGVPCTDDENAYQGIAMLLEAINFDRTAEKVGAALIQCASSPEKVLNYIAGVSYDDPLLKVSLDVAIKLAGMSEYIIALTRVSVEVATIYAAEKFVSAAINAGISLDGHNTHLLDGVFSERMINLINQPCIDLCRSRLRMPFSKIGRNIVFNMTDFSRDPVKQLLNIVPCIGSMMKESRVNNARLVIAGGSPLGAVTGVMGKISDLDIFVVSETQDVGAGTTVVMNAIAHIMNANSGCIIDLTPTVVTVRVPKVESSETFAIQFVLRLYKSAAQVVMSFDLAPSRFLLESDGRLFCTRSAAWSVANQLTLPDPLMTTYSARALKYSKKGLPFAIPDMDWMIRAAGLVVFMTTAELKVAMRRTSITGILALARMIHTVHRMIDLDPRMYGESESRSRNANPMLIKSWRGVSFLPEVREMIEKQWCVTDPCIRMIGASGASYLT